MKHIRIAVTGLGAVAALTTGIVAPAVAEDTFSSYMSGWGPEHSSRTWSDRNTDNTNGYAQFSSCDESNFPITIYHEDFGPDTAVGSERIQCNPAFAPYQSLDRVYEGDVKAGKYHFTLKGWASDSTNGGEVDVKNVKVVY